MSQRRRDPPPPRAVCIRCGWQGRPHHAMLRDDYGDVSLILSAKKCPKCGHQVTKLEPPPSVVIQIVTAIRAADLSREQLDAIATAARAAHENTSPRALAEQIPFASQIITVASRVGPSFLAVLALAVSMYGVQMDKRYAKQAHQDAERALAAARSPERTGSLPPDELPKLAERIEDVLKNNGGD